MLDLTRVLSGPHAGRTLADLGADVVKVEPPDGDVTRFANPRVGGLSTYFVQQNVGKRNISIDLSSAEGTELVLSLAEQCDVLLENFRPGVMAKLGLGYEVVAARNPRLIYASISGYGQTGPWAHRRAYAATVAAEVGLTKRQGDARGGVHRTDPHSHADVYTGMECVIGVLAALHRRERTGDGDHIDVAMAATMLYVNEFVHDELWDRDVPADQVRSFGTDQFPVVTAANGDVVAIAASPVPPGTFEHFVAAMGRPDLLDDERFDGVAARIRNLGDLDEAMRAWASTMPSAVEIERALEPEGLAAGQVRSTRELAATEWAVDRRAVVDVDDRAGGVVRVSNSPWRFRNAPADVVGQPRYRGEDNRDVLSDLLGLGDREIDELEAAGVLSSRLPVQR